jgi:hypothetical protein
MHRPDNEVKMEKCLARKIGHALASADMFRRSRGAQLIRAALPAVSPCLLRPHSHCDGTSQPRGLDISCALDSLCGGTPQQLAVCSFARPVANRGSLLVFPIAAASSASTGRRDSLKSEIPNPRSTALWPVFCLLGRERGFKLLQTPEIPGQFISNERRQGAAAN